MLEKFKKLPLRKGVGIVLLNQNNEVFVAKRIDNPNNYWQMPRVELMKMRTILMQL